MTYWLVKKLTKLLSRQKRELLAYKIVRDEQIWSAWVDWREVNPQWSLAFRQAGGDSLGGGLFIPPYFFLQDGWKVRPREANHKLVITGNLFTEDGSSPVVNTLGNYNVSVQYTVPVQAQAMATSGGSGGLTSEQATQLMKTATKADVINAAMM